MAVLTHHECMTNLVVALGLDPRKVRRFVLDASVDSVVTLYVEEYPGADAIAKLAESIKGVEVARAEYPPEFGAPPLLTRRQTVPVPPTETITIREPADAYAAFLNEGEPGTVRVRTTDSVRIKIVDDDGDGLFPEEFVVS